MLALVLLVVAQAEIEVPATVAPLSRLLPELGQRANMRLVAGASVREDVVGIASPKRPVRELMDGIAEAVNATWTEKGGEWVLARTKDQESEDRKQEVEFRRKQIARTLSQGNLKEPFTSLHAQSLAERRKAIYSGDQEFRQIQDLDRRSPVGRFGFRVLEAIGLEALADIPPNRTVVFSSRPTARQRRLLPNVASALFAEFVKEQQMYADAAKKVEGYFPLGGPHGFDFAMAPPSAVDKILVVVSAFQIGNLSPHLILADAQGKVLLTTQIDFRRDGTALLESLEKGVDEVLVNEGWILDYWSKFPLPADVISRLRRPAEYDPQSLFFEGAMRLYAKVKSRPVIMLISDLYPPYPPRTESSEARPPMPYAAVELNIRRRCEIDVREDRVIIRPHEPVLSRRMRTSRAATQEFIRASDPRPTVRTLSALMGKVDLSQAQFALQYAQVAQVKEFDWQLARQPLGLLRLAALGNQTSDLTFAQMNEQQRELARFLVYEHRLVPNSPLQGMKHLSEEPTEAFPNDLPRDAKLSVRFEEAVGAKVGPSVIRPENLSYEMLTPETRPREFQMGEFRHYTFRFDVGPKISHELKISDTLKLDPQPVTWNQLPATYREMLEQRIAEGRRALGWPP